VNHRLTVFLTFVPLSKIEFLAIFNCRQHLICIPVVIDTLYAARNTQAETTFFSVFWLSFSGLFIFCSLKRALLCPVEFALSLSGQNRYSLRAFTRCFFAIKHRSIYLEVRIIKMTRFTCLVNLLKAYKTFLNYN